MPRWHGGGGRARRRRPGVAVRGGDQACAVATGGVEASAATVDCYSSSLSSTGFIGRLL